MTTIQSNKKNLLFFTSLFLAFVVLTYFFPYSGDDWAWGSEIGIERLETWFHNYNGRYAGNLLVLLLTRSQILKVITIASSLFLICYLPKIYTNSNRLTLSIFSAFLLLLVPKQIFVQAISWTSGYSNYIPPILITLIYFVLVRNIFGIEKPTYKKYLSIITFLMGFTSTLFMENVTLYNIAVSFVIIFFVWYKFKSFYSIHIAHFVGGLIGAIAMFTNSAYGLIATNNDSYRSTALSKGLFHTLNTHTDVICEQFFINNLPMLIIITILCTILTILYEKTTTTKKIKLCVRCSLIINSICLFILFSKEQFTHWVLAVGHKDSQLITTLAVAFVILLYCLSVLTIIILCVEDINKKLQILLPLCSVPVLIAPLLVVNPIGPRCFFPPYVMLLLFCVAILDYIQTKTSMTTATDTGIQTSLLAACIALFLFQFSIYSVIHTYDQKRNEYVSKQFELGYDIITICKLPYTSYTWYGDPTSEPWDERYKLFWDIDETVTFEFLSYSQFNKWQKEFDKSYSNDK